MPEPGKTPRGARGAALDALAERAGYRPERGLNRFGDVGRLDGIAGLVAPRACTIQRSARSLDRRLRVRCCPDPEVAFLLVADAREKRVWVLPNDPGAREARVRLDDVQAAPFWIRGLDPPRLVRARCITYARRTSTRAALLARVPFQPVQPAEENPGLGRLRGKRVDAVAFTRECSDHPGQVRVQTRPGRTTLFVLPGGKRTPARAWLHTARAGQNGYVRLALDDLAPIPLLPPVDT